MTSFAIIELDDGLTVVELQPGEKPEDAAVRQGGVLADPGPYPTYDEAYDALVEMEGEEEDEERA
jgi:hypothetical protein